MTESELSTIEEEKQGKIKSKKHTFGEIIVAALLVIVTIIGVAYFEICKAPFNGNWVFSDTFVTVNARYNVKYNVIKIDLIVDEVIEDWQVKASNGNVEGISLECETSDKSIKREFKFDDVSLKTDEKIETSISIENAKLKDFLLVKDLLSGEVTIRYPLIISLDNAQREKMKQYYTSGAAAFGALFWNYMMGGQ